MNHVHVSPWAPAIAVVALFAIVVFAMGYGIIGVAFVLLLGGLIGGALMSYIGGD